MILVHPFIPLCFSVVLFYLCKSSLLSGKIFEMSIHFALPICK